MINKLKMHSVNKVDKNIREIGKLFPNCLADKIDKNGRVELAIDFDMLKQELCDAIVEGSEERYQFTWPDKRKSVLLSNAPIAKTLRPCKEESVNFDTTENIYIEGDNLDILKLLQETYLNKIKIIYIDPPYNTGNDFIYKDDFSQNAQDYLQNSGQFDEEGNRLFKNMETNGRFHTDWLNMMYPRLKLAKDLLKDDGAIFISIDENEQVNLKKICDEIFGESNFVENFIWSKNSTKNLSKTTSTNHEYILCFAKNKNILETKSLFRIKKPGLDEVNSILRESQDSKLSIRETEAKLIEFYKLNYHLKGIASYTKVELRDDKYRAYSLSDSSAPKSTGRADTYEILHPITKKPCKVPVSGWRYKKETMQKLIDDNLIEFYDSENNVPRVKRFLDSVESEVIKSLIINNADGKKELARLFSESPFDNPKPTSLLTFFLQISTNPNDIILDFFSGSATTAHAVMQLNAQNYRGGGGDCKFILVQLPELVDEKSEAYKHGFNNICEIGKERIRRAGFKIKEDSKNIEGIENLDIGFRVLKLDSTNMKDVYYSPNDTKQKELLNLVDNIKEGRTPLDLLFQVMLDLGILLSSKIETITIDSKLVFNVENNFLISCFDENITEETIKFIAKQKPYYFVLKDSSISNDNLALNFDQIFQAFSPDTIKKVL